MTPTETATPPPNIRWEIGDGVSDEVALEAREAAKAMRDYLARFDLPEIDGDVVFYIYSDTAALAGAYARETGWDLESSVDFWESGLAVSGKGWVFLKASNEWFASAPRKLRMRVTAHELYHVYQRGLSGLSGGARNHQVPESGPRRLSEGGAEFSAYRAMSEIGELSYDDERDSKRGFVDRAKRVDKPLSEMETWNGIASEESGYVYSLMAAELLASRAGEGALTRHYALAQPGATWRDAFETAFGMTVDDFYDLFEKHRAAGFPNP